jgi:O-acetyl-ADP-ribose deacetylase (regulator of RNase III)
VLTELYGDLLDVKSGIIVHQVNCQGAMGAGIARQIAAKWPHVKSNYVSFVRENEHEKTWLLGKRQLIGISDSDNLDKVLYVANLFGQLTYGPGPGCYTKYNAVKEALETLAKDMNQGIKPLPIFFPCGIGCGLGGGDWQTYYSLIEKAIPTAIIVHYMPPT